LQPLRIPIAALSGMFGGSIINMDGEGRGNTSVELIALVVVMRPLANDGTRQRITKARDLIFRQSCWWLFSGTSSEVVEKSSAVVEKLGPLKSRRW